MGEPGLLVREEGNGELVRSLYEALGSGDVETVQRLLAPDIEWWFHGPPSRQHMMRMLTGQDEEEEGRFRFEPASVTNLGGGTVLAEGLQGSSVFWVHAWTVGSHGVITQIREYFNTSLTVTHFAPTPPPSPSSSSSSPSASPTLSPSLHCLPLWESSFPTGRDKSMPAVVLAI